MGNYLTSLSFSFLINKMKIITVSTLLVMRIKCLAQGLVQSAVQSTTHVAISLEFLLFLHKGKSLKISPKKAFVEISQCLYFSYSLFLCLSPLFTLSFSSSCLYVLLNQFKFPQSHSLLFVSNGQDPSHQQCSLLWSQSSILGPIPKLL